MAKLFALLTAATALVAGAQAACPANRRICGNALIDTFQCQWFFLSLSLSLSFSLFLDTKLGVSKLTLDKNRRLVQHAHLHHPRWQRPP